MCYLCWHVENNRFFWLKWYAKQSHLQGTKVEVAAFRDMHRDHRVSEMLIESMTYCLDATRYGSHSA